MVARRPSFLLRSCRQGVAAVEFALITPFMLAFLMGAIDLAHYAYVRSVLTGAVQKAGRDSALESGATRIEAIDQRVSGEVLSTIQGATLEFDRTNFEDATDIGKRESFDDSNGNGNRDPGECFDDFNGNGVWDADRGRAGQGGAERYVVYRANITFRRLLPRALLFGLSDTHTASAETILINQPYADADDTAPVVVCT